MTDHRLALEDGLAGRYRIERELGRGGMAVVYLATDLRHDRPVALKVLHPDLAHALGADRFRREIHVAARLQHPHILTVLDSGEAAGQFWFTMPYVNGESLRQRLDRQKQLPLDDATGIARQAAQALQYAHENGVVHRDIKPENLMLTADGNTLVADFGIARALGSAEGERLTQTGTSIGTAEYMSPEQAAGEREVDARSDIYSLGIVLYEMLAGETPFAAPTPQATIARRFTENARPLRNIRDTVPESVGAAVLKSLARTAVDRFPTARAFGEALMVQRDPIATAASRPRDDEQSGAYHQPSLRAAKPRSNRVALALAVAVVVIAGGVFAWSRTSAREPGAETARSTSVEQAAAVRIAVLPFQNLGDTADAYFAGGITDAIRGKLAAIHGLEVLAGASSDEYLGTTKGPGQIADELGVDYLLTGRVRWVKQADGTSRVQVSPELIEIADGSARTRWAEPFDAPLTDVFAVQGDIAGRVSGALDVALGASDRQRLAERPTANLAAYDAYLQAQAVQGRDPASYARKAALLEQAVALDPGFGIAWAGLSNTRSVLAGNSLLKPLGDELRGPLERAMALAPDAPETYRARMVYSVNIERDLPLAMSIIEEGVQRYPADPLLLRNLGSMQGLVGDREASSATLRRAVALDPRNVTVVRALATELVYSGRQSEARDIIQRALALAPGDYSTTQLLVVSFLSEEDLASARAALNGQTPSGGRGGLLAYIAVYGDFYWVLDRAQQDTVLGLPVADFADDAASRALVFAQIHHARGDSAAARRWAGAAADAFQALGIADSADPQVPGLIGLAQSFRGRHGEARSWFQRAVAAGRASGDTVLAGYTEELRARGMMLAGERDAALAALEESLERYGPGGAAIARLHPEFAPLRGDPRFERITR